MSIAIRFLDHSEFLKTKALAEECFGASEDTNDYYSKSVFNSRIAALEDNGVICSMVHLQRFIMSYDNGEKAAWYLLYGCTARIKRRLGYMSRVINYVLDTLKREGESYAFLVPVDKSIYLQLGFSHFWKFNENERNILYADDGLEECAACVLDDSSFEAPKRLIRADSVEDFYFKPFDEDAFVKYFDWWFSIRPTKCCDSIPLSHFLYASVEDIKYCMLDNRCLLLMYGTDDTPFGYIPFCRENELVHYFKLQERYYNDVLKLPFRVRLADCEGVEYLKAAGALDNYEITENMSIFDYIYDAEELRTLPGRKFAKKRNRISKFNRSYAGRWEYRTLGSKNRDEIISFLKKWYVRKLEEESDTGSLNEVNVIGQINAAETLEIDVQGTVKILNSPRIMSKIKVGGIYVDGELCAFSIGGYNALEKMVIIEIEKADPKMDGLYQLLSREFLIHEFPQAKFVNREDDAGLPGLRKSKMSLNPIAFEKKFYIAQKDFDFDGMCRRNAK